MMSVEAAVFVFIGLFAGGRSVPIPGADRFQREIPHLNWRHGNFINTATGQAYNPMDPMGFIFEGNNKQYTKGNGMDTPTYDPDKYSYTYAGVNFQPFPILPSTGGAFMPVLQNFHTAAVKAAGVNNDKANTSAAESGKGSQIPDINNAAMIEMFRKLLNNTNMYPHAVYSGTPGMLGIGSQSQFMPQMVAAPAYGQQYIDPNYENLTETEPPRASYSGLPGMEGEGSQVQGSISSLTIAQLPQISALKQSNYGQLMNYTLGNPVPLYNGMSGAFGTELKSSGKERMQTIDGLEGNITDDHYHDNSVSSAQGLNFQTITSGKSGLSTYGMEAVQQTKVNNWNGEWPGDSSAESGFSKTNQNWNGDWSENWPTRGEQQNDNSTRHERATDKPSNNFGNVHESVPHGMNWDGSWPGQTSQSSSKDSSHTDELDNRKQAVIESTLTELKALISTLENVTENTNSSSKGEANHSKSFSDLAMGWKEDMKNT